MRNDAFRTSERIGWARLLANLVPEPVRPVARLFWSYFNKLKAVIRQPVHSMPSHGLPSELIISLTSYPPRFGTLHLTLRCLLSQSVRPDRVILWVAHDDMDLIPPSVTRLCVRGLEIRACEDLRSYKKLIPALETYPDAYIAIADDDVYYPSKWLEGLVRGVDGSQPVIVGRRAVRLVRTKNGKLAPFGDWKVDVADEQSRLPSTDLVCEGCGGVLYPPRSLHRIVTNRELFQSLCPDGDDLWFYWCARMAGSRIKKVGESFIVVPWPGTQNSSLWESNERGGNDAKVAALVAAFGSFDQAGAS